MVTGVLVRKPLLPDSLYRMYGWASSIRLSDQPSVRTLHVPVQQCVSTSQGTRLISNMHECNIEIINKLGLHARAAAKLVKLCSTFESTIEMDKKEQSVNCKSIMGVMMLAASCGTVVTVRTHLSLIHISEPTRPY